jgi:2-oxoglutarate ferredoxin oxidoreductase subunit alpha
VPKPIIEKERGVKTGIICYGSSFEPVREARDRLKARGLKTNHMLIRALPLTSEVRDFLAEHDTLYLVEQNRDAQVAAIIKDEHPELGAKITSILVYDGLPVTAGEVVRQIFEAAQTAKTA